MGRRRDAGEKAKGYPKGRPAGEVSTVAGKHDSRKKAKKAR
jgi:hypothetical protein